MLDTITPSKDKKILKAREKEDKSSVTGSTSKPMTKQKKNSKNIKKKKMKKKKKKRSSSSDEDSDDFLSSDSEEDPDLEIKDTDDDFKKREKMFIRMKFLEEKEKKAKAYQQWKKDQWKM